MNRNKYSDDPIIKNVTKATIGKCRWTGITGIAGEWYYDLNTHTMHNFKKFFNLEEEHSNIEMENPEEEIEVSNLFLIKEMEVEYTKKTVSFRYRGCRFL